MTALAKDRNTPLRDGVIIEHPVAGSAKIYAGGIVVANASGYAAPGSTATGLTALGRSEEQVDNGSGSDGDVTVKIRRGVFKFANYASDQIASTDIYSTCYIVDDQTVAKTDGTGTRSAAGKVMGVDSDGVWVEIR